MNDKDGEEIAIELMDGEESGQNGNLMSFRPTNVDEGETINENATGNN